MVMRLTVAEQVSRSAVLQGRPLAVRVVDPTTGYIVKAEKLFAAPPELRRLIPSANIEVRTRLGLLMDASVIMLSPDEIDTRAAKMDALFEVNNPRQSKKILPKTLDVEGQPYKKIMVEELTAQEGAQILKPEDVNGHNAEELKAQLSNPSGKPLTYINVKDALNIVKAMGGTFRLMTNAEVDNLPDEVRSQLRGDFWFLVETERGSGQYNWRRLGSDDRGDRDFPEDRYFDDAVRLVEDKKI